MSTWRNPTFMRRRQLRLMAEEQQRAQRRHLLALTAALASDLAAEAQPPQGAGVTLVDWADAFDAEDQAHLLRTHLH